MHLHVFQIMQSALSFSVLNELQLGLLTGCHSSPDATGLQLPGLCLDGSSFRHLKIHNANFRSAYLKHAHFDGAQLTGSDFVDADLSGGTLFRKASIMFSLWHVVTNFIAADEKLRW
jgi:uncharacterized protein YjbI with pentapeptide repeats